MVMNGVMVKAIGGITVSGLWLKGSRRWANLMTLRIDGQVFMADADDFNSTKDCFQAMRKFRGVAVGRFSMADCGLRLIARAGMTAMVIVPEYVVGGLE